MSRPQEKVQRPTEKRKLLELSWRQPPNPRMIDLNKSSMQSQIQAYCTCGKCIAGYISPRMKWLLMHYALIYQDLLPRTLSVFDGTQEDPSLNDLDAFNDLSHMSANLRRSMQKSIRVMHGYCEVFKAIAKGLGEDREPTAKALQHHVDYSWSYDYLDAKVFFEAGGMPEHALQYLLVTLKRISLLRNSPATLEAKIGHLPRCLNDTGYDMVTCRLLQPRNNCILDMYTHVYEKEGHASR